MRQEQTILTVHTRGQGFIDITRHVAAWIAGTNIRTGMASLFLQHTSAGLLIQENADPDVLVDLTRFLTRLAPEGQWLYRHHTEGLDDMPAHIRTLLTGNSLTVPVRDGGLALGTWQGLYLVEHRTAPHDRHLVIHLIGA
jgi:secondary thiamine-phosphate synthase enzyme